jgi:hypothetical protein
MPDRWAAGGRDLVEQAPPLEERDAGWADEMEPHDVAREGGAIDQQDAVPFARQQHGGGSAGAPRADDNGIVHR